MDSRPTPHSSRGCGRPSPGSRGRTLESWPLRKVALATHYLATGPAFELEEYLRDRTDLLVFVAHPLGGDGPSYARAYLRGQPGERFERRGPRGPGRFIAEVWQTVRWVTAQHQRFDLFIAGDNLLALAGLWLRRRGRVRAVLLYTIDFVPRRFRNPLMNRVYHLVDRLAVRRANVVWNVSEAIAEARRSRDGDRPTAPQIVVPLGARVERIRRRPLSEADPHRIAFLGHLLEKQGLQLAIVALPAIRRIVPDATLMVLGDGPYRSRLEELAAEQGVADAVRFLGFIQDHREVEDHLAGSAIAIAPYVPDPASFTRYADPGKIKNYLACGLPIVLTGVPPFARRVEAEGAGRIIPYEAGAFTEAVLDYLADPGALDRARSAAARLGSDFAWERIFSAAWKETLPLLGAG